MRAIMTTVGAVAGAVAMVQYTDHGNGMMLFWGILCLVGTLGQIIDGAADRIIEQLRNNRKQENDSTSWIVSVLREREKKVGQ